MERTPTKDPFASAVANTLSILVLGTISLATYGYTRALTPLYGAAPTEWHLNKVVWAASIVGSFAPTIPTWPAVFAGGLLLTAMPTTSYWMALYTGRMGDITWGPVATHLTVLAPVLYLGVAMVKALQDSPDQNGITSSQFISMPVCRMAIMTLQDIWPMIKYLNNVDDNLLFATLGGYVLTMWMFGPFLIQALATIAASNNVTPPVVPAASQASKSKKQTKAASSKTKAVEPSAPVAPSPKKSSKSNISDLWRLGLLPFIPLLTQMLKAPTLPKPMLEPFNHPTVPLRVLNSTQSLYSGIVLVGEVLAPSPTATEAGDVREPHSIRYLRAGHSLLGGVWIGDRSWRRDLTGPLSQDEFGTALGDSIYGTFVLQEAARLVERPKQESQETALIIGLGAGIAASAYTRHGISTTLVEIDPTVYDAATRYFGLTPPDHVFLEDARNWVGHRKRNMTEPHVNDTATYELFDYVVHDCFSGGGVPGHIFTTEFWADVKGVMKPDGVLAVNFLGTVGSDSARAITLTLQKSFKECRLFHEHLTQGITEKMLREDGVNWVVFCSESEVPMNFRKAKEADYLGSFLREAVLQSLPANEFNIASMLEGITEKNEGKYTLTDLTNPLVDWQKKEALHHWEIMRNILPHEYWETY